MEGCLFSSGLRCSDPGEHGRDDAIASGGVELEGAGGDFTDPGGHGAANHRARAMQARLDRFLSETQSFSRFAGTQAFDVAQHEHGAIRVGKGVDGLFEHPMKLLRVRLALGIRLR